MALSPDSATAAEPWFATPRLAKLPKSCALPRRTAVMCRIVVHVFSKAAAAELDPELKSDSGRDGGNGGGTVPKRKHDSPAG